MRILTINWQDIENPQVGGAEMHITEILKRLVARGHQATLFCSGFPNAAEETVQDGIKVIRRGLRFDFNWVIPFHLRSILKKQPFDIVVEDLNKMPFFSPLFHRIPTLVIIHHFFGTSIFKETNWLFGSYVWLGEKTVPIFYRRFPFLTISESSKQELVDRGISPGQITVISNGISELFYTYGKEIARASVPTILYVGRIKKYKGIQHLVMALPKVRQRIPTTELKIAGSGDFLDELKGLVAKLNLLDCVQFTGFVSEEEKIRLYRQAWVSVYPSLKEGWGLSNIDANACGTPVVASNVPGLRDSVLDGKTGLLFRYGDIDDLADKLTRILSNRKFAEQLSQGAIQWAKNFSWDKTTEEVEALMEKVVKVGRR